MNFRDKIKVAAVTARKVKEVGSGLQAQFKDSKTVGDFAGKILEAAKQGFLQAGMKAADTIKDETKFAAAIDYAHSHLPLPYRLVLPKMLITKLMRMLREKITFKNGNLEFDEAAQTVVVASLQEEKNQS